MINQWKALLEEKAADWNLPTDGKWSFLLFNNYTHELHALRSECNIDLLWFHDGGKYPRVVTKLSREEAALEREFQNLTQAHTHASKWVPRPLGLVRQGELWGLWMEGVPGTSSLQDLRPAKLKAAAETLASMHKALRNHGTPLGSERHRRMVIEPIETVARLVSEPSVLTGCAELRARISPEWMDSLPLIPQHGDLMPGNLLSDGDRLYVVDWENFGKVDFPFYDLLTLLVSLLTERGERIEHWNSDLVKQVPDLIECYAQQLGLRAENVALLLPLTLANWLHLQWCEGRQQFADRMHKTIQHYFEHSDQWLKVFGRA